MPTLDQLLTDQTPDQRVGLLAIFERVLAEVKELHAFGKVHGALCPSLISVDEGKSALLSPGEREPETAYLSPEQLREERAERSSDLYSLGVILYEVITGRLPFERSSYPALVLAILTEPPVPPSQHWHLCPPGLEALCLSMIAKEKRLRPKQVEDVALALASIDLCAPKSDQDATDDSLRRSDGYITPGERGSKPPLARGETYEILEEIGRGGAGRILRAIDRRIGREIALKESLSNTPIAIERFIREALITARLEHPAIVPIHETGSWADGSPFYTMKLIKGRPLDEVLASLSLSERIELLPRVLTAAEAIAYAHSKGIIHRDLKPQNILIGGYGETIVIDWGLAKDLRGDLSLDLRDAEYKPSELLLYKMHKQSKQPPEKLTQFGTIVGTPAYMPPEQAEGRDVDERADVYSLGAILYHLLSGEAPYHTSEFTQEALTELQRRDPTPLERLQPETPKDLVALVNKAMSRAPKARYASAVELCNDLDRFLRGGLVSAHHYSLGEIIARSIRRYRAAFVVAAASLLTLSTLGVYSISQIIKAKNTAEENATLAKKNESLANYERGVAIERLEQLALSQARALVESSPLKALAALKLLSPGSPHWRAARIRAADIKQRGTPKVLYGQGSEIQSACLLGTSVITAEADHNSLWDPASNKTEIVTRGYPTNYVECAPDQTTFASSGRDNKVRLVTRSGQARIVYEAANTILDMSFSHDSRQLAIADQAGSVTLIDVQSGAQRGMLRAAYMMRSVRFSPDGRYLAAVGNAAILHLFDLGSGAAYSLDNPGDLQRVRFSPDGRWVATASYSGGTALWSVESRTSIRLIGNIGEIWNLAFSPDSQTLITAGQEKRFWRWSIGECAVTFAEGCAKGTLVEGHNSSLRALGFSHDGRWLATTSMDRSVRLWNTQTWEPRAFEGHEDVVSLADFLPNDQQLLSYSWDGTVRLWDINNGGKTFVAATRTSPAALSKDGQWVATVFDTERIRLTNVTDGTTRDITIPGVKLESKYLLIFSPSGDSLLLSLNTELFLLSLDGALLGRQSDPARGRVFQTAFSPDGHWIAAGSASGETIIWNPSSGASFKLPGTQGRSIAGVAFSPDGALLATVGSDMVGKTEPEQTLLWPTSCFETQRCSPSYSFQNPTGSNERPIFSPDGKLLTIGNIDLHSVIVFNLNDGSTRRLPSHGGYNVTQAFSPDGKLLATAGLDTVVRLWDTSTWEMRELRGHQNFVKGLAFSRDSGSLATGGFDQTLRIWDVASGEHRVLSAPDEILWWVFYPPQNDKVISVSDRGVIRVWADDLPRQEAEFWSWLEETPSPQR